MAKAPIKSPLATLLESLASSVVTAMQNDPKVAAMFEEHGLVLVDAEEEEEEAPAPKGKKAPAAAPKGKAAAPKGKAAAKKAPVEEEVEEDEEEEEEAPAPKGKKAPAPKAKASKPKWTSEKLIAALEAGKEIDLDDLDQALLAEVAVDLELYTAKKAKNMNEADLAEAISSHFEEEAEDDEDDEDDEFDNEEDEEDEEADDFDDEDDDF